MGTAGTDGRGFPAWSPFVGPAAARACPLGKWKNEKIIKHGSNHEVSYLPYLSSGQSFELMDS